MMSKRWGERLCMTLVDPLTTHNQTATQCNTLQHTLVDPRTTHNQIGRTGRAGLAGKATCFYVDGDGEATALVQLLQVDMKLLNEHRARC